MNTFAQNFNEVVNNIDMIVREARHASYNDTKRFGIGEGTMNEAVNFSNFMHDVNFKMFFMTDEESYVMSKMLDAMDHLRDILDKRPWPNRPDGTKQYGYRLINSLYDCVNEFYFENK